MQLYYVVDTQELALFLHTLPQTFGMTVLGQRPHPDSKNLSISQVALMADSQPSDFYVILHNALKKGVCQAYLVSLERPEGFEEEEGECDGSR